jgi:hypothetical protein
MGRSGIRQINSDTFYKVYFVDRRLVTVNVGRIILLKS